MPHGHDGLLTLVREHSPPPPSFRVKQKLKSANLTIVILVINLIRTNLTDILLHHVTH